MPFNINDILSKINEVGGLVQASHYYVVMSPPQTVLRKVENETLAIFCTNASLPGLSLKTNPIRTRGYGIPEQRPVDGQFSDLSLTFLCDASGQIMDSMHTWLQSIYNFDASMGPSSSFANNKVFEFAYPVTYEGTIDIYVYDSTAEIVTYFSVLKAFPIAIQATEISYENSNTLMKVQVQFAYASWKTDRMSTGTNTGIGPNQYSALSKDPNVARAVNAPSNAILNINQLNANIG